MYTECKGFPISGNIWFYTWQAWHLVGKWWWERSAYVKSVPNSGHVFLSLLLVHVHNGLHCHHSGVVISVGRVYVIVVVVGGGGGGVVCYIFSIPPFWGWVCIPPPPPSLSTCIFPVWHRCFVLVVGGVPCGFGTFEEIGGVYLVVEHRSLVWTYARQKEAIICQQIKLFSPKTIHVFTSLPIVALLTCTTPYCFYRWTNWEGAHCVRSTTSGTSDVRRTVCFFIICHIDNIIGF